MLSLLPYFIRILLKDYLQQFLLPQYIMSGYQVKVTRHTKRQKTQMEEIDQVSEPDSDRAGMYKNYTP